jgi:hypothetical protein
MFRPNHPDSSTDTLIVGDSPISEGAHTAADSERVLDLVHISFPQFVLL